MIRFLILCAVSAFAINLIGQDPLDFEGDQVLPGTKRHFSVSLADGDGNETFIPITVFHGTQAGPVLGITAGVHGYEYSPILAGQQLIDTIDPSQLRGSVILVQIANMGSFLGRSPFVNPMDGRNLNRAFPGDAEGTITARIAHYISGQIIPRSDFFVDMHSGDAPEDLRPYSGYYHHDDRPEISEKAKLMAMSMGFDHVAIFNTTNKDYMKDGNPSLYCSAEAYKRGIPAADIECGRLGMVEKDYVDKIVVGMESLLKHLDMLPGEPIKLDKIAIVADRSSVSSAHDGFFYPTKSSGDYVLKGMKLGYITNFFHETIAEVQAERTGIIMYILGTPPVNTGDTVASIGIIDNEDK